MKLGIFAKTFPRSRVEETLDAVVGLGLTHVQFNMLCAGGPTLPEWFDPELCERIAGAFVERGLTMAAVSGTFNMIHPDMSVRRAGLDGLHPLALSCAVMGAPIITICTGTRDPEDMWRHHPDNLRTDAWRDLLGTLRQAVPIAESYGITLAIEPEAGNVVNSARRARRLLDEVGSAHLKVVIDPANLVHEGEQPRMQEVLEEAFELLGPEIVLAHAKEFSGEAGYDLDHYLGLLRGVGYEGVIVMHGVKEEEAKEKLGYLREKLGADRDMGIDEPEGPASDF